ncbi:MAG TPA: hypothetical protein ENN17_04305 [bacterium]|nr:hypothetical protein [bacterium]
MHLSLSIILGIVLIGGVAYGGEGTNTTDGTLGMPRRTSNFHQAPDRWIARDKAQHLVASMILTGMKTYRLHHVSGWGRERSLHAGAVLTFGLGVMKEIYDLRKPFPQNRFSLKDLTADLAGIALGVLLLGWW